MENNDRLKYKSVAQMSRENRKKLIDHHRNCIDYLNNYHKIGKQHVTYMQKHKMKMQCERLDKSQRYVKKNIPVVDGMYRLEFN